MLSTHRRPNVALKGVHPRFATVYTLLEVADMIALADVIPDNAITVIAYFNRFKLFITSLCCMFSRPC